MGRKVEQVHTKLLKGFNLRFKPLERVQAERKWKNKDRTLEEHKKLVEKIMKRDQKLRKRIEAVGIEYESPQIKRRTQRKCGIADQYEGFKLASMWRNFAFESVETEEETKS